MAPKAASAKAKANAKAAASAHKATLASTKAVPLWQQLHDDGPLKRERSKPFKAESKVEFATWKALKANLRIPGMKPDQIRTLVNADGVECYQKMLSDRVAAERGDADAPKFGPKCYEKIIDEFGPSESPAKKLKVTDPRERIDEELLNSLSEIQSVPKSYERAFIFLAEGGTLNQRSFVLLAHQVLKTNSSFD